MKIKCEDVGNIGLGAAAGAFLCSLGAAGSSLAQDLTGYKGNLMHMELYGGLVTYPIVYGTTLGILGNSFLSKPWTIPDILITGFSTIPVSIAGTLLGYTFMNSPDSLGDTAKNAAIASTFIPLVTTTLVGAGYGLYKAISYCIKSERPSEQTVSEQTIPEVITVENVNQPTLHSNDMAALTHQSQLLEEGRVNYQAVATTQRSPREFGLFPARSNQESGGNQGPTMTPPV